MTLVLAERVAPTGRVRPVLEDRCQMQRVLVAEEHELVLAGLRAVLLSQPWVASCLVADSQEAAWQVARRHHPQLVFPGRGPAPTGPPATYSPNWMSCSIWCWG